MTSIIIGSSSNLANSDWGATKMLTDFSQHFSKFIPDSEIIVKRAVRKLYHVTSGRNAWHSTWIRRYNIGSMHLDLYSAKRYAEKLRTNGSVFYIKEIPAIVLQGENIALIITQINCKVVLGNYRPNGLPPYRKPPEPSRNNLLPGSLMHLAASSFASDSRYWKSKPPSNESALIFTTKTPFHELETYKESSASMYTSEAVGAQYLLSWKTSGNPIQSKSLLNIIKARNRKSKQSNKNQLL